MLKITLAVLITIEILIIPMMIFSLSVGNILLPGLGLIISGGLVFIFLLLVEIILISITIMLYRRLPRSSGGLP